MVKNCVCGFLGCLLFLIAVAQTDTINTQKDSLLKEVIVTAFNFNGQWKDVPGSIALVSAKDLTRFSSTSFVPILNSLPGVRMEERSPGSYRIALRGSSLRAPFGVRNIKVYLNEIPLSDGTGNTYINLLDLQSVSQIEIAKGPASSMYGAGTGGAILLNKSLQFSDSTKQSFNLALSVGAFGMNQQQGEWISTNKKMVSSLLINRLVAAGYREQSFLEKNGLVWQTAIKTSKSIFNSLLFITDLNYGTPGGITAVQMELNPRLSRQPTVLLPGALQQKTAVYNQTIFGAVSTKYQFNQQNSVKWFVSLNRTSFKNPFITNYEQRHETNINIGFQHIYSRFISNNLIQWINGVELLLNESLINNYTNNAGITGAVISKDVVFSKQQFFFSQLKFQIAHKILITAGFSTNQQLYNYKRLTDLQPNLNTRVISAPFVPRIAMSYPIWKNIALYLAAANGFSSPSLAEVRPSDGNFYPFLEAEKGWNVEAGLKGNFFNNLLLVDISYYRFKLNDAIVSRTDLIGAAYFVNAGSTMQAGGELLIKSNLINRKSGVIQHLSINGSLSYQPYRFLEYRQGAITYDGNNITGIPKTIVFIGIQSQFTKGYYFNLSINASGRIPLNDANTVFADNYQLVQSKMGKIIHWRRNTIELFIGGDNLFNQLYSLGNDINAAGNRFFNPAPSKNFYGGIRIGFQ